MCKACPEGYECPRTPTWSQPQACTPGTYSPGTQSVCSACDTANGEWSAFGAKECQTCNAGYQCVNQSSLQYLPHICPLGTYSTGGISTCADYDTQANGGDFNIWVSGSSLTSANYCDAGYECLPGSTSNAPVGGETAPGTYRGATDQYASSSSAGYYCGPGATSDSVGCTQCTNGEYCPKGSAEPEFCPPGHYCDGTGSYQYPVPMAGGYYVNVYAHASSTGTTCPAGFFCPAGSSVPKKCSGGYYCIAGISEPSS